jgi:hypothetical protein
LGSILGRQPQDDDINAVLDRPDTMIASGIDRQGQLPDIQRNYLLIQIRHYAPARVERAKDLPSFPILIIDQAIT